MKSRPFVEGNRISVFIEVAGAADYLPAFAGNLDIITAAAIKLLRNGRSRRHYYKGGIANETRCHTNRGRFTRWKSCDASPITEAQVRTAVAD